jgi:hypothetical protein
MSRKKKFSWKQLAGEKRLKRGNPVILSPKFSKHSMVYPDGTVKGKQHVNEATFNEIWDLIVDKAIDVISENGYEVTEQEFMEVCEEFLKEFSAELHHTAQTIDTLQICESIDRPYIDAASKYLSATAKEK